MRTEDEIRCQECGALLKHWGQLHTWADCEREKLTDSTQEKERT